MSELERSTGLTTIHLLKLEKALLNKKAGSKLNVNIDGKNIEQISKSWDRKWRSETRSKVASFSDKRYIPVQQKHALILNNRINDLNIKSPFLNINDSNVSLNALNEMSAMDLYTQAHKFTEKTRIRSKKAGKIVKTTRNTQFGEKLSVRRGKQTANEFAAQKNSNSFYKNSYYGGAATSKPSQKSRFDIQIQENGEKSKMGETEKTQALRVLNNIKNLGTKRKF
jgi:hypothetical protein